jgi:hypothetical protein
MSRSFQAGGGLWMPSWRAERELIALRKWADLSSNIGVEMGCTDSLTAVSPHSLKLMVNLS